MTPSKLSLLLGISILLLLVPPVTATADADEASASAAAAADLAELALREQQLRTRFDDRLRASVVAAIDDECELISVRTTELLRSQTRIDGRPAGPAPPAKRAPWDDRAMTRIEGAGDTTCTRVGHTLQCVLRDVASR